MKMMLVLVLPLVACSSANVDHAAKPLSCPMTIDELRAGPPQQDGIDYSADFATGSAACSAGTATMFAMETFEQCGSPYDLMTWYSFPDCGEELVYDHATGALVAVLGVTPVGGDACGARFCVAGPSQFVEPMPTTCTIVATCR